MFYGKGGYDYDTVYNMPVWLREYTYKNILEHYEREAEAAEKASKGQGTTLTKSNSAPQNVPKQAFLKKPDYVVKRPVSK